MQVCDAKKSHVIGVLHLEGDHAVPGKLRQAIGIQCEARRGDAAILPGASSGAQKLSVNGRRGGLERSAEIPVGGEFHQTLAGRRHRDGEGMRGGLTRVEELALRLQHHRGAGEKEIRRSHHRQADRYDEERGGEVVGCHVELGLVGAGSQGCAVQEDTYVRRCGRRHQARGHVQRGECRLIGGQCEHVVELARTRVGQRHHPALAAVLQQSRLDLRRLHLQGRCLLTRPGDGQHCRW